MGQYCMRCMSKIGEADECPFCGYRGNLERAPHILAPGTMLENRYMVGCALGEGGFGITYIGLDTRLDMRVAIKEYFPRGFANRNTEVTNYLATVDKSQHDLIAEGKNKFLQEAKVLAEFISYPGVVNVTDFFEENNTAYIIMEYLDGIDLRNYLRTNQLTSDQVFWLMSPIIDVLEKIHAQNVIHRDISPDNIMLLRDGTCKLMDFGAARQMNFESQKSLSIVLKAGFAPEEQYRSKGQQGPWTDVYALCATMYKCITGITPDDSLERAVNDEIKWPSELGFAIRPEQEAALKNGLAVRAENRIKNMSELKAILSGMPIDSYGAASESYIENTNSYYEPVLDEERNTYSKKMQAAAVKKKTPKWVWGILAGVLLGVFVIIIAGKDKGKIEADADIVKVNTGDPRERGSKVTSKDNLKNSTPNLPYVGERLIYGRHSLVETEKLPSDNSDITLETYDYVTKTYNMCILPKKIDFSKEKVELIFHDLAGTEYLVVADYFVQDNKINIFEGQNFLSQLKSGQYLYKSEQRYYFMFDSNYDFYLSYDDSTYYKYDIEGNFAHLVGKCEINHGMDLINDFYLWQSNEDGSLMTLLNYSDGGRAVSPETTLDTSHHSISITWKNEIKMYNGKLNSFDVDKTITANYINNYPYGFILISDYEVYFYQEGGY